MSNLIYKKMSEVMRDIGFVAKDQKNPAQGFMFRSIDQFLNALYPALVKHGVFISPRGKSYTQELKEVQRASGKHGLDKHVSIMMEYDFIAEDGSRVTVGPVPAEGLDSGDKATAKALSGALKYALIQTFSVPTKDMEIGANMDDGDFESPSNEDATKNVEPKNQVKFQTQPKGSVFAAPPSAMPVGYLKSAPPPLDEPQMDIDMDVVPVCCGKEMMVSKFPDPVSGAHPFFCLKCKKKVPRGTDQPLFK